MYHLARDPQVSIVFSKCSLKKKIFVVLQLQNSVRQEIMRILKGKSVPNFQDLGKFQSLGNVIKETLRMFPPACFTKNKKKKFVIFFADIFLRVSPPDQFSELNGYKIPPNTIAMANIIGLHYSPKYWENPQNFQPSRFDTEINSENFVENYETYLPFSKGERNCLGQNFALQEMKILVSVLLLNYEFYADALRPPTVGIRLTLRPSEGPYVYLKKIFQ
jgi:cytochrome P450